MNETLNFFSRKFLYDGKHSLQTRGLLVLLVSKAAGPATDNDQPIEQMVSGIYPRYVYKLYTALNIKKKGYMWKTKQGVPSFESN